MLAQGWGSQKIVDRTLLPCEIVSLQVCCKAIETDTCFKKDTQSNIQKRTTTVIPIINVIVIMVTLVVVIMAEYECIVDHHLGHQHHHHQYISILIYCICIYQ